MEINLFFSFGVFLVFFLFFIIIFICVFVIVYLLLCSFNVVYTDVVWKPDVNAFFAKATKCVCSSEGKSVHHGNGTIAIFADYIACLLNVNALGHILYFILYFYLYTDKSFGLMMSCVLHPYSRSVSFTEPLTGLSWTLITLIAVNGCQHEIVLFSVSVTFFYCFSTVTINLSIVCLWMSLFAWFKWHWQKMW